MYVRLCRCEEMERAHSRLHHNLMPLAAATIAGRGHDVYSSRP